jgi:hypothetical protein
MVGCANWGREGGKILFFVCRLWMLGVYWVSNYDRSISGLGSAFDWCR